MTTFEVQAAATRLCAACGMCCNGVLFYSVRLQPADSARDLRTLGLKVKRRSGEPHVLQPCPAHQQTRCTIYEQRPERCRVFECRQLKALAAGEITEAEALAAIQEARRLVDRVRDLFREVGETRERKAFSTRYETLFNEPIDPSPGAASLRGKLTLAMRDLEELLARNFRIEPVASLPPARE